MFYSYKLCFYSFVSMFPPEQKWWEGDGGFKISNFEIEIRVFTHNIGYRPNTTLQFLQKEFSIYAQYIKGVQEGKCVKKLICPHWTSISCMYCLCGRRVEALTAAS